MIGHLNDPFEKEVAEMKGIISVKKPSKKITYVITISERFPAKHPKAGEPTGFPLAIKHYDKIHTIRGNYELWRKRFEKINAGKAILSVRSWSGKPYQSKQLEYFRYDNTHGIGIQKIQFDDYLYSCIIDGRRFGDMWKLIENDGLSESDFEHWFNINQLESKNELAIIHFTDFRY